MKIRQPLVGVSKHVDRMCIYVHREGGKATAADINRQNGTEEFHAKSPAVSHFSPRERNRLFREAKEEAKKRRRRRRHFFVHT